MGDNSNSRFTRRWIVENHLEVFISTLQREKLIKFFKVKFRKTRSLYKILALTFSFLPAMLVGNLILGTNLPNTYQDQEIAFKHVATPVIVFFDGQKQEFITEKANIEDALNGKGVKLGEFDITYPARKTNLNGTKVEVIVKRARPVVVLDNGKEIKAQSAYEQVSDILLHLGIKTYQEDKVAMDVPIGKVDITPKIVIDRLNPVVLNVDGQNINLKTTADKVKDLLAEKQVVLATHDIIDPGYETFVGRDMTIKVIRVSENTVIEQVEIPFDTEYVYDNNLSDTEEITVQGGASGLKEQVVNIVYQNGWQAEKIVLHEKVLSNPVKALVRKGTKQAYSGFATWYGPGFEGGRTASGEPFNPCVLAAAHRTLPFGTMVRVTNVLSGRSCVVRINDRGPYSYHIIDLTRAAADAIGMESVAPVILEVL